MNQLLSENIDKWKIDQIFNILEELEDEIEKNIINIKTKENYDNIVLRTLGKSIRTYKEIAILSMHGYPNGAFVLARTIYENFIILCFFQEKRNEKNFDMYVTDYYLNYDIMKDSILKYECENCIKDDKEKIILADKIKQAKNRAQQKVKGNYWWSGQNNFYEIFKTVIKGFNSDNKKLFYELHSAYKLSSILIHSSCLGNFMNLGEKEEYNVISTAPEKEGQGMALWFATVPMIGIVGNGCDVLKINYSKYSEKLHKLVQEFSKSIKL